MADSPEARRIFLRRVLVVEGTAVAGGLLFWLLLSLHAFLLDFLISAILAIVLNPLVRLLGRLRIARSAAVVVVVLVGVSVISLLLYVFTKPLYRAGVTFAHELPSLVAQAQSGTGRIGSLIKTLHIESFVNQSTAQITSALTNFTGPVLSATRTVLSGIGGFVTIALLAVFILLEGPGIVNGISSLFPEATAEAIRRTVQHSQRAVAGFVLGNLATSVIAGVVVGVTLALLGVPFVMLLSLWVALVDLLPLVGGLLAGVPTVAVALLHSPIDGLITAVVFIAYQQVENHVLNPLIMARTVRLKALWILVSVIVGADMAGFLGALIGIPVAAIVQVVAMEVWSYYRARVTGAPSEVVPEMPEAPA
ncbi:MAG: AI-2E family transporter [Actinomycetota bacterium]|nr:AI-2E family transporter [Actinomycetota bacterium]MDA8397051.1 AI-2E family transporter [Actinomycetota bacterium]